MEPLKAGYSSSSAAVPYLLCAFVAMAVSCSADFRLLSDAEPPELQGAVHGEVSMEQVDGRSAVSLGADEWITIPTAGNFDPEVGGLEAVIRPDWQPDDGARHTIFHVGENDAQYHFTVFKTEGGAIRFVIKHDPQTYAIIDYSIADWQAGQWHTIRASWRMIGDQLLTTLQLDDGPVKYQVGGQPIEPVPPDAYIGRRGPISQFADAALAQLRLTGEPILEPPFPVGELEPVVVRIDAADRVGPVERIYDCTTIWNKEDEPLPFSIDDPTGRRFKEADFSLARLVALSETWLRGAKITEVGDDSVTVDFSRLDRLIDVVRAGGAEPYIRIAYHLPKALSSEPDSPRWGYVAPKKPELWDDYVRKLVTHLNVERKLGVKYFVCTLNEADIAVARHGADWQDILKLHERTVRVALDVDPTIKVGGPAICMPLDGVGGECLREFVRYSNERDLPIDFICFHRYHRPHPLEYEKHLERIKQIVAEVDPDLEPEWFCDEYNLWARDRKADNEYGAAYLAGAIHYFMRGGLDKLSIVSFNDVLPGPSPPHVVGSRNGPFRRRTDQAARFLPQQVEIDGQQKLSILAHSPTPPGDYTFGRYAFRVPQSGNPRLTFSTGIAISHEKMDGVGFSIAVAEPQSDILQAPLIFEHFQRKQPWVDHTVSLEDYAGKPVFVSFRVDRGKGSGAQAVADHGVWGSPKLVAGDEDNPTVVADFARQIMHATTGVASRGFQFEYNEQTIRRSTGLPLIKGPVVTAPYFTILAENKLQGSELGVELRGEGGILNDDSVGVRAAVDGNTLYALVWTFALLAEGERKVTLQFEALPDGFGVNPRARVQRWLIDPTHTNPWYDYVILQEDPGDRYNLIDGELEKVEDKTVLGDRGVLKVPLDLGKFAVTVLQITPRD